MDGHLTVGGMLLGAIGLTFWTAAVIGGCFLGSAPIVAYTKYKAIRRERDALRVRLAAAQLELNALKPGSRP